MDKPLILVVEDNEIQCKVIKLLAAEYGYETFICNDCVSAMEAYASDCDFALILMDLRLPDIDGLECTRMLCRTLKYTARQIPVVAMTGYVSSSDRQSCIDMGFDDCLIKPFTSREFRDILAKWIVPAHNVHTLRDQPAQAGDS